MLKVLPEFDLSTKKKKKKKPVETPSIEKDASEFLPKKKKKKKPTAPIVREVLSVEKDEAPVGESDVLHEEISLKQYNSLNKKKTKTKISL